MSEPRRGGPIEDVLKQSSPWSAVSVPRSEIAKIELTLFRLSLRLKMAERELTLQLGLGVRTLCLSLSLARGGKQ